MHLHPPPGKLRGGSPAQETFRCKALGLEKHPKIAWHGFFFEKSAKTYIHQKLHIFRCRKKILWLVLVAGFFGKKMFLVAGVGSFQTPALGLKGAIKFLAFPFSSVDTQQKVNPKTPPVPHCQKKKHGKRAGSRGPFTVRRTQTHLTSH